MPILTGRSGHIDTALSDFAVAAFDMAGDAFVAELLFPAVPVPKQSDGYYILDKSPFLRNVGDQALRAPRTQAKRVEYNTSTDVFQCKNYALAHEFGLEEFKNLDAALQGQQRTKLVVGLLRMAQEVRCANLVTSISNVGSGIALTGANKWSDYGNSDPVGDVSSGQAFIRSQTGLLPNKALIDWDTMKILSRHPVLLDMYKYTQGGKVTKEEIAKAFELEEIVVAKGIRDQSIEGQASASMTNIWGNTCILAHVPPGRPSLEAPSAGVYRFQWEDNGVYPAAFGVLRGVEDQAGSKHVETIEVGHFQDEKVVARDLMYTINGTI